MSGMISGTDLVFETPKQGFEVRPLLDAVAEVWPELLVEGVGDSTARPPAEISAEELAGLSREFFVYKSRASADGWEQDGWTEQYGDDMAHFLIADDPSRSDTVSLTLVIGSPTRELFGLVEAVFDALGGMASDAPGREAPRRLDWEADLLKAGYSSGRDRFHDQVEEVRKAAFSEWPPDELGCHPRDAMRFCDEVRRTVGPVPDHLIMKALVNRRRQQTKPPGTREPRLFWVA